MNRFDFDNPPSRRGTGSYKWDSEPGEIPMWVADMDFRTAPCVIEALKRRVDHGVFGYTYVGPDYYDALCGWFSDRHGYVIDPKAVIYVPGVVPAISAIIKAMCSEGEGVIVQTPVYNCFFSSIRNNGCRAVENRLRRVETDEPGLFSYEPDFEELEELCSHPDTTLMLLCNPANPAGRIWTRAELERTRDICRRHGVRVVSDEIHCELTMPGSSYTPYGTIDTEAIVCVSPSKAFNTAGLQIANIVCPDAETRAAIDRAVNINEVCDVNPFGVEGLKSSYSPEGAEWLDELRVYLMRNWALTRDTLLEGLPGIKLARLEATYLPWVDVSRLGLTGTEAEKIILERGNVKVNAGGMYGDDRYMRLNIACPRHLLREGLKRIVASLS